MIILLVNITREFKRILAIMFVVLTHVWGVFAYMLDCRGLSPAQSEAMFLDHTTRMEMYGIDLYCASWVSLTDCHLVSSVHNVPLHLYLSLSLLLVSL